MDAITTYTYSTSAWFGIQAVPLLFFPQLVTALLSPEARRSSGTSSPSIQHQSFKNLLGALATGGGGREGWRTSLAVYPILFSLKGGKNSILLIKKKR